MLLGLSITCSNCAVADTILLRDGRTVRGTISAETLNAVTIDSTSGRFTFPREKVITITKETPLRNELRQMEKFLSHGNLDGAITFYRSSSLVTNVNAAEFDATLLQQLKPVATGTIATSGTALFLAAKYQQASNAPAELLLLTAAICMDSRNYETALAILRQIEKNVPGHFNWPAETVSGMLNRLVDAALKQKNGAVLAATTNLASQLPLPASTSASGSLAIYSQIEDKMRRKEYLSATAQFRPEMFLHRADLFVPLAERLLESILSAAPTPETLAALESSRISVLPYVNSRTAQRTLEVLISRLLAEDRQEEAQRLVYAYADKDPDMAAHLQHVIDFQRRKADLDKDDPMEAYKLAAWSRRMGLLDEAKTVFLVLRSDPRFAETVNLQLALIDHAQAEETVARLRRLFDTDDLEKLKSESSEFLRSSPPEGLAQQARDLVQLADFQTWSTQRSSQGKAEAEFQQAERLVNRREFDQALSHLNRIQLDRENSAAAIKAQGLRDKVMLEKLKEARTTTPTKPDL